jgi:monofunctional biosynthetic peptidoglycan transglycosylase
MRAHKVRTLLLGLAFLVLAEGASIPWCAIPRLRTENPGESALMRQRRDEAEDAGKPFRVNQRWIALPKIPRQIVDAIIVAEDGTFYAHSGFDWFEVRASVERNVRERRAARGASTITQQLAKNLFLSTSKDPIRKAKEALLTLLLEHYLTKDRILEIYLNIIEWGPGVFGIDAASRTYFGKPASVLTLDEGARLAAVIPSPLRHRPDADSRYVVRRKEIVLRRMAARFPARETPVPEDSTAETPLEFPVESPLDFPVDSSEAQ